ncbi:hypothetical protein NC797_07235 [Aquibacillus sp. 3ASR75-11]|uniref:SAF domain-containing protein n=1 Tax=Terrihalobacillus insolitus TaxID=2950438 RepID=A0A9X4ALJ4_9BACI|nr:hypothetical protein [Terrihalobacillus insolitus]MDC3424301.1 hypothetical protein [Terrihalobacillus insolitus]
MKPNTKIILGILTGIILLAAIPIYDQFIKDKIDSVEVVVVKAGTHINAKEPITRDKLKIERRRKQDLVGGVVFAEDMKTIIGYDAANLLVGNAMVSKKMVDFDNLIPDESEGEAIRPIVSDMIFAMPGSLRRKDQIDIYTISSSFVEEQGAKQEGKVVTSEEVDEKVKKEALKEPLLKDVRVVYVKDASNKEVVSAKGGTVKKGERLNATANISDLEVILNEENFQKLMRAVIDEDKLLYITYN